MPMRTKARPSEHRRPTAASSRAARNSRLSGERHPVVSRKLPAPEPKVPVASPNGINGYSKALRFLSSLSDYERLRIVRYNSQNFDLDRMRSLLKKLGNPHEQFKSVHVAGTKGKGSTCAMVASMLQANNYKVGL